MCVCVSVKAPYSRLQQVPWFHTELPRLILRSLIALQTLQVDLVSIFTTGKIF